MGVLKVNIDGEWIEVPTSGANGTNGAGVPTGGTSEQSLVKDLTGTDYSTKWADRVPTTRLVDSGAGLVNGGNLTTDRVLAVGAGTGITVNANDVAVNTTTIATRSYVDQEILDAVPTGGTIDQVLAKSGPGEHETVWATVSGVGGGGGALPSGGTSGQALLKNSATSGDASWGATGASLVLTVASSEAPLFVRERADYVCDGTGDQATINAAIMDAANRVDTAATSGSTFRPYGSVELSEGRFYLTGPILIPNKGFTLRGQGNNTIIGPTTNTGTFASAGYPVSRKALIKMANTQMAMDWPAAITIRDMYLSPGGVTANDPGAAWQYTDMSGIYLQSTANAAGGSVGQADRDNTYGMLPVSLSENDSMLFIHNVHVHGCLYGIAVDDGGSGDFGKGAKIQDCSVQFIRTNGVGVYVNPSDAHLVNVLTGGSSGTGITGILVDSPNTYIRGCGAGDITGSGSWGMRIESDRVNMSNCGVQTDQNGVYLGGQHLILDGLRIDTLNQRTIGVDLSSIGSGYNIRGLSVHVGNAAGGYTTAGLVLPANDSSGNSKYGYIEALVDNNPNTGWTGRRVQRGSTASEATTMPTMMSGHIVQYEDGVEMTTLSNDVTGGAGLTDGDMGDITVGGTGTTLTIDNDAVSYAKIQNVTNDRLLGRQAGTSGDIEEIPCTAAARTVLDDTTVAAMRTTLGVPTITGTATVTVGNVEPTVGMVVGDIWVDTT